MKMNVTPDQIWELSTRNELDGEPEWDSIVKFNTWMGYEWDLTNAKTVEDTARWTDIQTMIAKLNIVTDAFEIQTKEGASYVTFSINVNGKEVIKLFSSEELCDALYKAIKCLFKNKEVIECQSNTNEN